MIRKRFRLWLMWCTFTVIGALVLGILSACSTAAPPDQIGLYYMRGALDGYHFGHCFYPATKTDYGWNNEVIFLPASQRTWNIAPEGQGGDSSQPIIANSAPEQDQPSGTQVSLWVQFAFSLNTDCGADSKDPNSPIVRWWEDIGRRYYEADGSDGKINWWRTMLENTIVSAAGAVSRQVIKQYQSDDLVNGIVRPEAQQKITDLLMPELNRLVGGNNFFCSPSYDPRIPESNCGEIVVLITDVDYTNPAIQAARDNKQAAIEQAAADLAAAQGQVAAAQALEQLYNNPQWVHLEELRLQTEQVRICAASPNCTIIMGGTGDVITNANR